MAGAFSLMLDPALGIEAKPSTTPDSPRPGRGLVLLPVQLRATVQQQVVVLVDGALAGVVR